jgi:AcrR family transcriptional regulator
VTRPENGDRKGTANKVRPVRGEKKRFYLEQAKHLFAEFGYAATSFEQIADAAGVTRSVLVKSYRDKPAFLRAIGDAWLESIFPSDTADDQVGLEIVARLQATSERMLKSLRSDYHTARILLTGLAERIEEEEAVILLGVLDLAVDRLMPLFLEGQQAGVIRRGIDARQMASDCLRFILGAALLPPAEVKEGESPASIVETLLHGVLKTDV